MDAPHFNLILKDWFTLRVLFLQAILDGQNVPQ
jgi:hypothetical protein